MKKEVKLNNWINTVILSSFFGVAAISSIHILITDYNNHLDDSIVLEENKIEVYKAPKEFLSLIKNAEGFSNNFYKDNIGFAIGYGWNITRNTKEFNRKIADFIQAPQSLYDIIDKYSNKKIFGLPKETTAIAITDEQAEKAAGMMFHFYENEFLNIFNKKYNVKTDKEKNSNYYNLPTEYRAIFSHMAYKLGSNNLNKFNNFFTKLNIYMLNPNEENKYLVSNELNYKYKVRTRYGGFVRKMDKKVSMLHKELLLSKNNDKIQLVLDKGNL